MRDAVQELIDVTVRRIILDEGFARDLAEIAHACEQDGAPETAEGIPDLSRHHRIKPLEKRAGIAALRIEHAGVLYRGSGVGACERPTGTIRFQVPARAAPSDNDDPGRIASGQAETRGLPGTLPNSVAPPHAKQPPGCRRRSRSRPTFLSLS